MVLLCSPTCLLSSASPMPGREPRDRLEQPERALERLDADTLLLRLGLLRRVVGFGGPGPLGDLEAPSRAGLVRCHHRLNTTRRSSVMSRIE